MSGRLRSDPEGSSCSGGLALNWNRRLSVCCRLAGLAVLSVLGQTVARGEAKSPNIVVVLADDLGSGDVRCYSPEGKIPTPNLDRLAAEGMRFIDCEPARPSARPRAMGCSRGGTTGGQNFRAAFWGLSPRLIEPGRTTVASLLKQQGYHTACVGKWHLGMDWVRLPGFNTPHSPFAVPEAYWERFRDKPLPLRTTEGREDLGGDALCAGHGARTSTRTWAGCYAGLMLSISLGGHDVLYFADNGPNSLASCQRRHQGPQGLDRRRIRALAATLWLAREDQVRSR